MISQQDQHEQPVLTLVYRTLLKDNAVIVNLDASLLYTEILDKLNIQDEIYVVSSDGIIQSSCMSFTKGQPLTPIWR